MFSHTIFICKFESAIVGRPRKTHSHSRFCAKSTSTSSIILSKEHFLSRQGCQEKELREVVSMWRDGRGHRRTLFDDVAPSFWFTIHTQNAQLGEKQKEEEL